MAKRPADGGCGTFGPPKVSDELDDRQIAATVTPDGQLTIRTLENSLIRAAIESLDARQYVDVREAIELLRQTDAI